MKFHTFFLIPLILAIPSFAQIEFIPKSYFPADLEFEELQNITSENLFSDSEHATTIENGPLIVDVGFDSYEQRTYRIGTSDSLSLEVITLLDYRAAYSLLTLLRKSDIQDGPPGDAYTSSSGTILFCHGKRWIRIRGQNVSDTLLRRVASSVSNRMGEPERKFPSLIAHLPDIGQEITTLEYFPGSKPFESFSASDSVDILQPDYDMEIARVRYRIENQSGILSLLKFPTPEMSESYYSELSLASSSDKEMGMYLRRSGPLLCILEGSFDSARANDILSPIQYAYSLQWIYEKKNRTKWGVPIAILNSTVLSFFLVLIICFSSILVGTGLAAFRLLLRRFVPNNPLDNPKRTEITRLKLP